jgi:hypothetical protein
MSSVSGSLFDSDDPTDMAPTLEANLPDGTPHCSGGMCRRTLAAVEAAVRRPPVPWHVLMVVSPDGPAWYGNGVNAPTESQLSRVGLSQYAAQALLRCVSLDRTFYRAANLAQYERLVRQVPDDFRFLVKAPAEITDAVLRDPDSGAPLDDNPRFLDGRVALDSVVLPAARGLGPRLGALVFQLSPLPRRWLEDPVGLMQRLDLLWRQVVPELPDGAVAALELRARWRSRRDSNPRCRFCPHTPLAGEHLRPLGHDSGEDAHSSRSFAAAAGPQPLFGDRLRRGRRPCAAHARPAPCTSRRSPRWS